MTRRVPSERTETVRLRDGRKLAYGIYGDPEGSPVVYCHGGMSSHLDISFADESARRHGVRIVAPDRPGIGDSDRAPRRTVADWADDVGELAAELQIAHFPVLGWSSGGPFALGCGARLAPLVTGVVTVGTLVPLGQLHSLGELGLRTDRQMFLLSRRAPSVARLVVRLSQAVPTGAMKRQRIRSLPSNSDRLALGALSEAEASRDLAAAVRRGPRGVVDDYATVGADWGFRLDEVTVPVVLLFGEEDTFLPRSQLVAFSESLPNARVEFVRGHGHHLHRTQIDRVLDLLVSDFGTSSPNRAPRRSPFS